MRDRARRKCLSDKEIEQITTKLLGKLKAWSSPIGDSDADAYEWEVREPGEDGEPRLKYLINASMMVPGALSELLKSFNSFETIGNLNSIPIMATAVAPSFAPPPLFGFAPQVEHQYYIGVAGQQYGPYVAMQLAQLFGSGQLTLTSTKVWRQGLAGWVELGQFPELTTILASPSSTPPQLMPPSL